MEPEYELSILSSEFSDIFVSTNVSWKIEDNKIYVKNVRGLL